MAFEQLQYEVADHIATITFNRPQRLNALTRVMEAEIFQAMEQAGEDPEVRVIVVTGAGRAFCAGMDMDELEVLPPGDIRARQWMRPYDMNRRADYQTRYAYFPAVAKPVIAAINGAAAGLGMIMALYSDLRFASEAAVFSTAFSRRGLIAEHGIAWMLPRVVGPGHAADLLFSARKVQAEEALRMGLIDRLLPADTLLQEVRSYAGELVSSVSPRSLRVMKRQLWDSPFQTLGEAVADANREMYDSLQSEDFREGVAHFQEHRPARFTGR